MMLSTDTTSSIPNNPVDDAGKMHQVDRDLFQDRAFLDKGIFGHVWLVELVGGPSALRKLDSRDSQDFDFRTEYQQRNPKFALKSINLNVAEPDEAAVQLANEALILSELDHVNIIKLRGIGSEMFSGSFASRNYFLLLDVLDETLQQRLDMWGKKKTINIRRSFRKLMTNDSHQCLKECQRLYNRIYDSVLGIAKGLEYLHSKKIVWCDVKPANIGYLNDRRGGSESTVKLIDFGMAAKVEDCGELESRGSLRYMSPAVMIGERYTLEDDVFSFGVLLAQICSLRVPYSKAVRTKKMSLDDFKGGVISGDLRPMEDLEKIIPCERIQAIIEECLGAPAKRPTCTDIVERLTSIFDRTDKLNESCSSKLTMITTSLSMSRSSIQSSNE